MKKEAIVQIFAPIVLVVLSCAPFSTSALTTFGKTNSQSQNQPPPPPTPVGKARECNVDSDCTAIQNTTCMPDRLTSSEKTQCLCGDYSAPINGMCHKTAKAVHVPCSDHAECASGSECVKKNNTTAGKTCQCKENFYEVHLLCNGADSIKRLSSIALMAMAMLFAQSFGYST